MSGFTNCTLMPTSSSLYKYRYCGLETFSNALMPVTLFFSLISLTAGIALIMLSIFVFKDINDSTGNWSLLVRTRIDCHSHDSIPAYLLADCRRNVCSIDPVRFIR